MWASEILNVLGICSVCLALVYQPQWKRELLPFPLARFVTELTHSDRPDGISSVFRNKLFWYAFGTMVVFHLINGIHAWVPNFISIPLQIDFEPLEQLFEEPPKIAINLKTAELIGFDPPVDILLAADEIFQDIETPPSS